MDSPAQRDSESFLSARISTRLLRTRGADVKVKSNDVSFDALLQGFLVHSTYIAFMAAIKVIYYKNGSVYGTLLVCI